MNTPKVDALSSEIETLTVEAIHLENEMAAKFGQEIHSYLTNYAVLAQKLHTLYSDRQIALIEDIMATVPKKTFFQKLFHR